MPAQNSADDQKTAAKQACSVHAAVVPTAESALGDPLTTEQQPEPAAIESDPKRGSRGVPVSSAVDEVHVARPSAGSSPVVDAAMPMRDASAAPGKAAVASPSLHDSHLRAQQSQQRSGAIQLSPDVECISLAAVLPLLPSDSCGDSPPASAGATPQGSPTAATAQLDLGWPQQQSAQVSCHSDLRQPAALLT